MLRAALTVLVSICCSLAVAADENPEELPYGETTVTRTGAQLAELLAAESLADSFRADQEVSWYVYVPETYDPETPAGLLVYISPTPQGYMPRAWRTVVEDENLIVISAHHSGNHTRTKRRMLLAILAPYVMAEQYEIDANRVYLSGFSGGGKVASVTVVNFPQLFDGAIFICGVESWSNVDPALLARAQQNRYVFVTGTRDFNRLPTKKLYRKFTETGMVDSLLLNIPGMEHTTPGEKSFREAIAFLDKSLDDD